MPVNEQTIFEGLEVDEAARESAREIIDKTVALKFKERADQYCTVSRQKKDIKACNNALYLLDCASVIDPRYAKDLEQCQQCYNERFPPDFVTQHLRRAGAL